MSKLGVRSYAQSMTLENFFKQKAMPDLLPSVKAFTTKILQPTVKVVEDDCHTMLGRNVSADDYSMVGLLALDTDEIIDEALHVKIKEEMKTLASAFIIYDKPTY